MIHDNNASEDQTQRDRVAVSRGRQANFAYQRCPILGDPLLSHFILRIEQTFPRHLKVRPRKRLAYELCKDIDVGRIDPIRIVNPHPGHATITTRLKLA